MKIPQNVDDLKGKTVIAEFFQTKTNPPSSLAGFQMKLSGEFVSITGKINHVYGNHPTDPTTFEFAIEVLENKNGSRFCEKHQAHEIIVNAKHCKLVK